MALWGITALGLLIGYRPPKRHTRLDHLSFLQKLRHLDLVGFGLMTAGLTLLLTGLNLGGGLYAWTNVRVLATLVIGLVILAGFGLYEWKGTKTGVLNHGLFRGGKNAGRTVAICIALIFIEGLLLFAYIIFYPVLSVEHSLLLTWLIVSGPRICLSRTRSWSRFVSCLTGSQVHARPFCGGIGVSGLKRFAHLYSPGS